MTSRLNPYMHFIDNARAAMEFYKSVFGGELTVMTFGQGGMSSDPAVKDMVMHSQLETKNGFTLMASDTPPHMMEHAKVGGSISISLSGGSSDEAELKSYWSKLIEGGSVFAPLEKAPWGDQFGMCTDKFGTEWMVNIAGAHG